MENNLIEFNKYITMKTKDFSFYEDEKKGIMFPLNTVNLLTRVDYLELDKTQYEAAKFSQKIEDLGYEIITVKKPVPKNEITGKDEDKTTIVEKDVAVRRIWNVSNSYGAFKSFTNKDDAIKLYKEINDNVFNLL